MLWLIFISAYNIQAKKSTNYNVLAQTFIKAFLRISCKIIWPFSLFSVILHAELGLLCPVIKCMSY